MIVNAVNAHAERFDALIIAEGIENAEHVEIARALGARFGQGWHLGQPGPQRVLTESRTPLRLPAAGPARPVAISPFTCLAPDVQLRHSTKLLLIELSHALEREAERLGHTCLVVTAFQHADHLTGPTLDRYRKLADSVGLLAVLGQGVDSSSVPGALGMDLREGDPVRQQWDLVVLSPHFSAALLAHQLDDQPAEATDDDPRFEFALVYDRETVSSAAHSLLARVGSLDDPVFSPAGRPHAGPSTPSTPSTPRTDAPLTGESEAYVEQLERMAFQDGLTELGNRRQAQETFEHAMATARGNGAVAVLYLDINNFKDINDRYGHLVGDAVLQDIARRLQTRPRWRDRIARIGGDEFLLVLPISRLRAGAHARRTATELAQLLATPVHIDGLLIDVSVSVGVGVAPDDGITYEEIVSVADRRMYARKHATPLQRRTVVGRIASLRWRLDRRDRQ